MMFENAKLGKKIDLSKKTPPAILPIHGRTPSIPRT